MGVLVQILQKLRQEEVLQCCALTSRAWNEAAALSIGSINKWLDGQSQADALSQWLQTHGPYAISNSLAVESFTVSGEVQDKVQLLLPMQHLKALQHLQLWNISVSTPGADAPAPVLDSGCALLTSLVLQNCQVGLQGLSALTGLQRLQIELPDQPQDAAASNAAIVADAVPELQQLTELTLGGPASQDAALEHLSRLTALQQLALTDAECTTASFLQLPSSLTMVSIECAPGFGAEDEPDQEPLLTFSSTSSPGLCQLTALKELTVQGGQNCYTPRLHVEVLSTLTNLTKLSVYLCKVMSGPGQPKLALLTSVNALQHLHLHK
jgi:hypothetical protein